MKNQVYDGTENQDDDVDIDIEVDIEDDIEDEGETGVNDDGGALVNQDENGNGNNVQSNQVLPQFLPWTSELSKAIVLNQNQGVPAIVQMDQIFSHWDLINPQWAPPEDRSAESYSNFFSMVVRNCGFVYSGLVQIAKDLNKYGVDFGDFSNGKAKEDFGSFIANIKYQDSNYGIRGSTYILFINDIDQQIASLTLLYYQISMFIDHYNIGTFNGLPIQFHYSQSLLNILLLRLDGAVRIIKDAPFELDSSIVSKPHYQSIFSQLMN